MSTTLTLETVNEIGEHLRRSIAEVDMILISASERDDGRAWLEQLNRQTLATVLGETFDHLERIQDLLGLRVKPPQELAP
jgi:hypothetical protein